MARERPQVFPALEADHCKGCGRCVEACARGCITAGTAIHPASGLAPVALDLAACNGCGLCVAACPEPWALVDRAAAPARDAPPAAGELPDRRVRLPATRPLLLKGNHAAAVGALLAGCRHFFGYPITPSTEGAELMAKLLPALGGTFLQAASEVAAVNLMYGCAGAGKRTLTFTSGPGFSLMLEGISYLIGAELPAVFVNVMRAGPGLGNIGPEQADVKLACRGLGHGSTHAPVLAPSSPQELLDFTLLAFDLAFRWRTPVVVLTDGVVGQMAGRVALPPARVEPGLPAWAVSGDAGHRRNLHCSIQLQEPDQEAHVLRLLEKYRRISAAEQRAERFRCDDAEVLLVACNAPGRAARGAAEALRAEGIAAGLFRPQTLWPFPIRELLPLAARARRIVVVEASDGQLEDEVRLALSHTGAGAGLAWSHVRHHGGVLPTVDEIAAAVRRQVAASATGSDSRRGAVAA